MDALRLSDAERDEAVHRLGEHYVAGRLDKQEYDERTDAVWSARTRGDLRPVFADLEPPTARATVDVRYRARRRGGWRRLPAPVLVLLVLLVALTVLTHLPLILLGLFVWCLLRFHPRHHGRSPVRGHGGRW